MPHFIARISGSPIGTLAAHAMGLLRVATIGAVLAVALHPSTTSATEPPTDTDRAGATPMHVLVVSSVIDGGRTATGHVFDADDGEDRFDEGDDEFDCDTDDDEDSCEDEDRGDEDSDADEAGCRDYDDGEDRCLDGEVRTLPQSSDARPEPSAPVPAAVPSADSIDLTNVGALAAVIGLAAGGIRRLWRTRF